MVEDRFTKFRDYFRGYGELQGKLSGKFQKRFQGFHRHSRSFESVSGAVVIFIVPGGLQSVSEEFIEVTVALCLPESFLYLLEL